MMNVLLTLALAGLAAVAQPFDPLQHLGGNSPWFPGPEITGISSDIPGGCSIDQAAFLSRHASRYPDPSAYAQWTNLSARIHEAQFSTSNPSLKFLATWEPVLPYPSQEMSQISITGYKELYNMGVTYRFRYGPSFYVDNSKFITWCNLYPPAPRVVDSARLFARGYMGLNATTDGYVYAINSSDPRSVANSLSPSDICPTFYDASGGTEINTWQDIYVPPIQQRLNREMYGGFQFTDSDIEIIPYLCGFETQITGSVSPYCSIFSEQEILSYEYAQDLRYYYGMGPGTGNNQSMMLPILQGLVQRFVDGPNTTYRNSDGSTFTPNTLIAAFTNDGQIVELASEIGVFDGEAALPGNYVPQNRLFKTSNFVTMRGTISFERLNCSGQKYIRIRLNDVVYPVVSCQSGPGRSCPLSQYQQYIANRMVQAGSFEKFCNITSGVVPGTSFWTDVSLPYEILYRP